MIKITITNLSFEMIVEWEGQAPSHSEPAQEVVQTRLNEFESTPAAEPYTPEYRPPSEHKRNRCSRCNTLGRRLMNGRHGCHTCLLWTDEEIAVGIHLWSGIVPRKVAFRDD